MKLKTMFILFFFNITFRIHSAVTALNKGQFWQNEVLNKIKEDTSCTCLMSPVFLKELFCRAYY